MNDDLSSNALNQNLNEAFESFVNKLRTDYLPWYKRAVKLNAFMWILMQVIGIGGGVAATILAAVNKSCMGDEKCSLVGLLTIVLPGISGLAASMIMRFHNLLKLREDGRIIIEGLIEKAEQQYACMADKDKFLPELHSEMLRQVLDLEKKQNTDFYNSTSKSH